MKKIFYKSFLQLVLYAGFYVYILIRFFPYSLLLNIITSIFWIYLCCSFDNLTQVSNTKKSLILLIIPCLISVVGFISLSMSPIIWNLSDWILLPFSEISRSLFRLLGFGKPSLGIIILSDYVFMFIVARLVYSQLDSQSILKIDNKN